MGNFEKFYTICALTIYFENVSLQGCDLETNSLSTLKIENEHLTLIIS